ncbi:hypothetical protein [Persicirhabdus sediminis]|uniref:PH domain-containing protein n=1 Tax=Persicirhabdus sediminis TaxID=454144 RepID=A0A8J7SLI6_9BACT|nr:hypothetical protein [Persicirhabdus sediminis]MBK1792839.1 hypothetical protein [Persicirhabdus sediminis]
MPVICSLMGMAGLWAVLSVPLWPISLAHPIMLIWCGWLFTYAYRGLTDRSQNYLSEVQLDDDNLITRNLMLVKSDQLKKVPISQLKSVSVFGQNGDALMLCATVADDEIYFEVPAKEFPAIAEKLQATQPQLEITDIDGKEI